MKEESQITITLTDDNITLTGQNLQELTEADIVDSIKVIVSLAKALNIIWEGDSPRWKCVNLSSRYTRMAR